MQQRIKGWHMKLWSQAGKDILIKSVAYTTHMYSMNYFQLQKEICDDIIQVMAQFWWDQQRMNARWVGFIGRKWLYQRGVAD